MESTRMGRSKARSCRCTGTNSSLHGHAMALCKWQRTLSPHRSCNGDAAGRGHTRTRVQARTRVHPVRAGDEKGVDKTFAIWSRGWA